VEVVHRLSAVATDVGDQAESALVDVLADGDLLRDVQEVAPEGILRRGQLGS
jgi:hypothetical protein